MESPIASPKAASGIASEPASPASHTSNVELTPRSKVRALLALSDDSDFDAPTRPSSGSKPRKSTSPYFNQQDKSEQSNKSKPDQSEDSASDSDVAPRVPVGRTARRLMGLKPESNQPKSLETSTRKPTVESEDDDDEDIPVSKQFIRRSKPAPSALSTPSKTTTKSISAASSPGLFVSPGPANASISDDNDLPTTKLNARLRAISQQSDTASDKTPKKTSKTKKTKSKKARRTPLNSDAISNLVTSENEEDIDAGVEDRLTQNTRTSRRKASKKAMEELNRETQRMARNQQLAHQAKTRKKYTKNDLFAKFNFNPETRSIVDTPVEHTVADKSSEDEYMMSGALISSDVEASKEKETPSTSPVSAAHSAKKSTIAADTTQALSPLNAILAQATQRKVEAITKEQSVPAAVTKQPMRTTRQFRVIMPETTRVVLDDSDDELEIVKPNKALALLDHLPVTKNGENTSLLRLRHLANLTSPGKKQKNAHSMNANQLQQQLREKARQQAIDDKEERIAMLRARGVHVQTYEEREKEQLELENLLEKARGDAVDIAKKEKAAAKKAGIDVDAHDILDDDDDDDWDGEDEAEVDQSDAELALSGSEDEDEGEADDEAEDTTLPFFDNEADESEGEDNIEEVFSIFKKKPQAAEEDAKTIPEEPTSNDVNEAELQLQNSALETVVVVKEPVEPESDSDGGPVVPVPRHSRKRMVVDDDDEDDAEKPASTPSQRSPGDEAKAAFGFQTQAAAFGLSQLLDSTLAGADSQQIGHEFDQDQDSLAFLRDLPDNSAPQFATPSFRHGRVPDSQSVSVDKTTHAPLTQINLGISQFPDFSGSQADMSPTKMSEMIEPTQDAGFAIPRFPIGGPSEPVSTVDTVMMATQQETPVAKKKGKLVRRQEVVAELSEEETDSEDEGAAQFDADKDAFNVLFNGAKKSAAKVEFNKKKSAAKGLVEEQAEESEDEYAGLGGASDDESNGEVDEEMQKMMDDGHVDVNERAVISLHA
jgi:mediator of replication checkpoint protein 1